jgi:hypothetical protein
MPLGSKASFKASPLQPGQSSVIGSHSSALIMYLGIVYIYQTSGQTLAIAADRPLKQYKKIAERIKFIL